VDEVSVSSTKIRKSLEEGDIRSANRALGRNYSITGEVIHGKHLGRTIGFPTANLKLTDSAKQIPAQGVYAVCVWIDKQQFFGMLNAGTRPTVNGTDFSIEVHIFNFEGSLYNQTITVEFVDKLRDEIRFANVAELKNQLEKDKLHAIQKLLPASN
jgi:riboflavin kinase/FMN adenylyltransferase